MDWVCEVSGCAHKSEAARARSKHDSDLAECVHLTDYWAYPIVIICALYGPKQSIAKLYYIA